MPKTAESFRSQGLHHHRPDLRHRSPHGARAGEARHGRPGRPRPRKARRGAEDHRAKGPARGVGRVRPVGSRERAARGRGDHRAPSSDRRPAQQRGHHADAPHEERAGLGHVVRDEPPRPVRADRSARAASRRWHERRLRRLRRRRPRAQTRRGRRLSRRPLHLRGGERARRVETRRFHEAGHGRLRHVEAVHISPRPWRSPARPHGCTSTRSSRASIPPPALARDAGAFVRFLRNSSFRCSCRCSCPS